MKKIQQTTSPWSLDSLPDELLLIIFAHISRLFYPILAVVSTRFRDLLASPMLYENRSALGRTESVLYVGLTFPSDPNPRWYVLSRKTDRALRNDVISKRKKKAKGYVLGFVSTPRSPPMDALGLVAAGSDIYNIGAPIYRRAAPVSPTVSVLDCKSNTWRECPGTKVEWGRPPLYVYKHKMRVALKWMEVFNIKTQTWESVETPFEDTYENKVFKSGGVDRESCVFGPRAVTYTPKEDRVKRMAHIFLRVVLRSSIDDILYYYSDGSMQWNDIKARTGWIKLKGLKGLPRFSYHSSVKLVDYGGKMLVLWDRDLRSSGYTNKMISCAVISLERRSTMEMWGEVESLDDVLTVPSSYDLVCALSPTL